eukprot:1139877-Pelagomonas_calceolata.AAC.4
MERLGGRVLKILTVLFSKILKPGNGWVTQFWEMRWPMAFDRVLVSCLGQFSQIITRLSSKHFSSMPSARTDNPADHQVLAKVPYSHSQALRKLPTLSRILSSRQSSVVVPEMPKTCISEYANDSVQQQAAALAASGAIPRKSLTLQAMGSAQPQVRTDERCEHLQLMLRQEA